MLHCAEVISVIQIGWWGAMGAPKHKGVTQYGGCLPSPFTYPRSLDRAPQRILNIYIYIYIHSPNLSLCSVFGFRPP